MLRKGGPLTGGPRPPASPGLELLDRDHSQSLLRALPARQPNLTDLIEGHVQSLQRWPVETASKPRAARRRQTSSETAALRRQVRSVLHSLDRLRPSEAYGQI